MRDYGLEPEIWDGDKNCEHSWKTKIRKTESFSGSGSGWLIGHEEGQKEAKMITRKNSPECWEKKEIKSAFCSKCNAWKGSLGLEPTFDLFIKHLCDIFDDIKRVLKPTGTCWINIGDTYSGSMCGSNDYRGRKQDQKYQGQKAGKTNLQNKSLCQIPSPLQLGHSCHSQSSFSIPFIPDGCFFTDFNVFELVQYCVLFDLTKKNKYSKSTVKRSFADEGMQFGLCQIIVFLRIHPLFTISIAKREGI